MALSFALLTNGQSTTNGLSFPTASVTVPAGALCVVLVNSQSVNTTDRQAPTGISGTGYTLNAVDNQQDASFLTTSAWRARQVGAFTGVITISYSLNQDNVQWAVYAVTGDIDTSGTNGSGAIGSVVKNLGTAATISQSLTFAGSNNGALAAYGWDSTTSGAGATATPATNWTEGSDQSSLEAGFSAALQTQFATNNQQPSTTWSVAPASGSVTLLALEIRDVTSPAVDQYTAPDDGAIAGHLALQYAYAVAVAGASDGVVNNTDAAISPQFYSDTNNEQEIAGYLYLQNTYAAAVTDSWYALEDVAGGFLEARVFVSNGIAAAAWQSVDLEPSALSSAGVAAFLPQSTRIQAVTLDSAGLGAFNPASAAIQSVTLNSSGAAVVTWNGVDASGGATIEARTLSSNGVAAASFAAVDLEPRSFASNGVAVPTFTSANIEARAFQLPGAGAANFVVVDLEPRAFQSSGIASALWQSATIGVEARTLQTNGVAFVIWLNGTASSVPDGDGGRASGHAVKQKLLIAYESEQARKQAAKSLSKVSDKERAALKAAAKAIADAQDVTYEDVQDQITASLSGIGYKPEPVHLDWLLYYLRILAYQIAQNAIDEEEEILMALMA